MSDKSIYKEKVREIVSIFMRTEDINLLDVLEINSEIVASFVAMHFADKDIDTEQLTQEVVELNGDVLKHHLSFLKSDMEKYTC